MEAQAISYDRDVAKLRRAEAVDLDVPAFDPAGALRSIAAACPSTIPGGAGARQAFLIEKKGPSEDRIFIGARPREILRVRGGALWLESRGARRRLPGNPFAAIGRRLENPGAAGRPEPYATGAVGILGYEMVRHLERLPALKVPPEEALVVLFDDILVHDRRSGRTRFWRFGGRPDEACLRGVEAALRANPRRRNFPLRRATAPVLRGRMGKTAFKSAVALLKGRIRAGDIFQAVVSERFEGRVHADAYAIYDALSRANPSPYQFLLKDGNDALIGASPERLVKAEGGKAWTWPIAGTRPRSADIARDRALERQLRRSPKERAEHLMLVDLARNDLGRVSAPGSVRLTEFMTVTRLASVMHLVSEVEGSLEGFTPWEALMACFPAGTVSGAPKVRAMELLSELEPVERGFYAGAFFQHDLTGNLDSCIAIRTMRLNRGRVILQAGAGIVADSSPEREYQEVLNKLGGLRRALALAES